MAVFFDCERNRHRIFRRWVLRPFCYRLTGTWLPGFLTGTRLTDWLLNLAPRGETTILHRIQPYGHTLFAQEELRHLATDLELALQNVTDETVSQSKREYVRNITKDSSEMIGDALETCSAVSASAIREHVQRILSLIDEAGTHHEEMLLEFVGD